MHEYTLHEIRHAELVREAAEQRLAAEIRKARRGSPDQESERRVSLRPWRLRHTRAA
ncbi:hypothetical protein [Streptomyces triticagri]|uniref:hypothetical protein n=1 Tax=Streptomyces triticagri TaxID=2293568 RepID=UPI0018F4E303|nr:hypothetical protein [Streptomyces triticagri]